MLLVMKTILVIGILLAGYFGLAFLQDGPVQIWFAALAPVVLVLVGFVLDVGDSSRL
jgi:hypothetical protein